MRILPLLVATLIIAGGAPLAFGEGIKQVQSTETFEAWTVRCVTARADTNTKNCEATHSVRNDKGAIIVHAAIGKNNKTPEGLIVVFQVPQGLLLSHPARMIAEGKVAVLTAPYFTCMQDTCLAHADTTKSSLAPFIPAKTGFLEVTERTGRTVRIEISFKGLAAALDRLSDQP